LSFGSDPVNPTPRTVRTDELNSALRLFFRHFNEAERELRISRFFWFLQTGEINREGVFVLNGPACIDGVIVAVVLPGAAGQLWPPICAADREAPDRQDALVRHALAWLRGRGVRMIQSLLGAEELNHDPPLVRNGVRRITALWTLRHGLTQTTDETSVPLLNYEPYHSENAALFCHILERTYEGSLDVPEAAGLRPMEQVLIGHRGVGPIDNGLWWLASEQGRRVGVVLLTRSPDGPEWELAYIGLIPEARGRGLGHAMLKKVLNEARTADMRAVLVSVDERNLPARRLYQRVGFVPRETRFVYLHIPD
jgi:mycothiol synthase